MTPELSVSAFAGLRELAKELEDDNATTFQGRDLHQALDRIEDLEEAVAAAKDVTRHLANALDGKEIW